MTVYVGTVCAFGFNFAPVGWALCQGQSIQIASYEALYALIGTTYGGNGTTTFNLPNMEGRQAVHMGQGLGTNNYLIGQTGGNDVVTLTSANMPAHTHAVSFQLQANSTGTTSAPNNAYPGDPKTGTPYATAATPNMYMAPPSQPTLAAVGGSQPINIQSACVVVNYSIALFGIFPQRA